MPFPGLSARWSSAVGCVACLPSGCWPPTGGCARHFSVVFPWPEVLTGHADEAVKALGLHSFDRRLPTVYVTGGGGSPSTAPGSARSGIRGARVSRQR